MAKKDDQTDEERDGLEDEEEADKAPSTFDDSDDETSDDDEAPAEERAKPAEGASRDEVAADDGTPTNLGATKYVHAAFLAAGVLVAFLAGNVMTLVWSSLAEWPAAVRQAPALLSYAEDDRPGITMTAGAVIGVAAVLQTYRKEHVRRWADDVALELSRVTWPTREIVTNGTIVVCVASVIATIYVSLLDRFWGFVTQLVYGV